MLQAIDASAGGSFMTKSTGFLGGVSLLAAGAAATAVVQETNGSGRLLAVLGAGIGLSEQFTPVSAIPYNGNVFVTITGAAAKCVLYEA